MTLPPVFRPRSLQGVERGTLLVTVQRSSIEGLLKLVEPRSSKSRASPDNLSTPGAAECRNEFGT
jgi:hypothetical protein